MMISIICCSISPERSHNLRENISKTVGAIAWEIDFTDNRNTHDGISRVYNNAALRAKGDILCFVHEDVEFHTTDWGNIVANFFLTHREAGVVGVAGAKNISNTTAGWYNFHLRSLNCFNLLQHDNNRSSTPVLLNTNYNDEDHTQVLLCDGVLMFVKKSVWETEKFNETIGGFHFYDIDFSIRVAQLHKNYVMYNILIEHFSPGNIDKNWVEAFLEFDRKKIAKSVMVLDDIGRKDLDIEEYRKLYHLLSNMVKFKYGFKIIFPYWRKLLVSHPLKASKIFLKMMVRL